MHTRRPGAPGPLVPLGVTLCRPPRRGAVVLLLLGLAVAGGAEEGARDWLARILDPASLGVTPPPGATLNRKLSVDTIRTDRDPAKRIAVYTVPLDRMPAAVEHLRQALHVEPTRAGPDARGFERWGFALSGDGAFPPKAKGLTVGVFRSPWVDGMAQVQMEYVPPKP
jgi:hypothetical protein